MVSTHAFSSRTIHILSYDSLVKIARRYPDETIPRSIALNALKSLQRQSVFLSFVTKPAVVILTGVACLFLTAGISSILTGTLLSAAAFTALRVVLIMALTGGAGLLAFGIPATFSGLLQSVSRNYYDRALTVKNYITQIQNNPAITHVKCSIYPFNI